MTIATDQQVQTFSDFRVRAHSLLIVQLYLALKNDKASIDDVFSAVSQQSPTWTDQRADGVAHLATPADILSYNEFMTMLIAAIEADANWAIIQKLLINPIA